MFKEYKEADPDHARMIQGLGPNVPGTVVVMGRVINAFGQYFKGVHSDHERYWRGKGRCQFGPQKLDSRQHRVDWTLKMFDTLATYLPRNSTVAAPKWYGCDMAGGDWDTYLPIFESLGARRPDCTIVLYDIQAPESCYQDPILDRPKAKPLILEEDRSSSKGLIR